VAVVAEPAAPTAELAAAAALAAAASASSEALSAEARALAALASAAWMIRMFSATVCTSAMLRATVSIFEVLAPGVTMVPSVINPRSVIRVLETPKSFATVLIAALDSFTAATAGYS
jgi:hypothetical protein